VYLIVVFRSAEEEDVLFVSGSDGKKEGVFTGSFIVSYRSVKRENKLTGSWRMYISQLSVSTNFNA